MAPLVLASVSVQQQQTMTERAAVTLQQPAVFERLVAEVRRRGAIGRSAPGSDAARAPVRAAWQSHARVTRALARAWLGALERSNRALEQWPRHRDRPRVAVESPRGRPDVDRASLAPYAARRPSAPIAHRSRRLGAPPRVAAVERSHARERDCVRDRPIDVEHPIEPQQQAMIREP